MDIITGKILKLNQWPDGKIIGLAKQVGNQLIEQGQDRDAVLTAVRHLVLFRALLPAQATAAQSVGTVLFMIIRLRALIITVLE